VRKAVDALSRSLHKAGFRSVVLHGGKSQDARQENLEVFKAGEVDILCATDVAGIDDYFVHSQVRVSERVLELFGRASFKSSD